MNRIFLILFFSLLGSHCLAQGFEGIVINSTDQTPIDGALVIIDAVHSTQTDSEGKWKIDVERKSTHTLDVFKEGFGRFRENIAPNDDVHPFIIELRTLAVELSRVDIKAQNESEKMIPMPSVMGTSIYRGMKSEIISLDQINANLGNNTSRQIYGSIAGLNIWESDGAGIQLGIGARGLSPNRTSHFNVRQDLHDISADALGYPESYYTPSPQAVSQIQLVRGAAALQYGTQFGGLLNFKMKRAPASDTLFLHVDQSIMSFGLTDSINAPIASSATFVSLSLKKKKLGIFGYYQYKQGDGWRARTAYEVHSSYASLEYQWNPKLKSILNLTHMNYLAEQPGGLTDDEFYSNSRQTNRLRNWFEVDWNIASLEMEWNPDSRYAISSTTFALSANRKALGYLGETQRPDPLGPRDLIVGDFKNIGHESRILRRWITDTKVYVLTSGIRLYKGLSETQQGLADNGSNESFAFDRSAISDGSKYSFPNHNLAAFTQGMIPLSSSISATPGIRYEYIDTKADGKYRNLVLDGAGNLIEDTTITERNERSRAFVLMGIGLSYKKETIEIYFNALQNYRAINFTDIQVKNTSLVIDPDIKDERGSNVDLGIRGTYRDKIRYDFSIFYLSYKDRIGAYFRKDRFNRAIRYRTNVADAQTVGFESYLRIELADYLNSENNDFDLSAFVNFSAIESRYVAGDISAFDGKKVELVPDYTLRTGIEWKTGPLALTTQYNLVASQFSDATNVGANPDFPASPNAVVGLIPSFNVIDLTTTYNFKRFVLSLSINNVMNEQYFTRRASGYPGPGIIPSDGRSFSLSMNFDLGVK